jgi:hypothetical protein
MEKLKKEISSLKAMITIEHVPDPTETSRVV